MTRRPLFAATVAILVAIARVALLLGVPSRFGFHMFARPILSRSVEHRARQGQPLEDRGVAAEHELRPGRRSRVGQ